MRKTLLAAVTVTATATLFAAQPAQAQPDTPLAPTVQRAALRAFPDLNPAQLADHLRAQTAGKLLGQRLTAQLGDRAAGFALDRAARPVVNVLDQAAADQVRAAGGTATLVRRSTADLRAAKAELDRLGAVPNTSWGIDPATDQVVVTISDAAAGPKLADLRAAVARLGDAVRVRTSSGVLSAQVADGDEIGTGQIICSAGFNVNSGGQNYIITAGHCTQGLPDWQGIGPSVDSSFPNTDYGLIRNDSGDAPGVVDLYDGTTQPITSVGNAAVGEQVCKSGRTTQVTCGTVQALDQTVNYGNGDVVYGLIQTNVYSDHGDSGGALFDGGTALGTVSGGDSQTDYFQPVSAAISAYGVSLN